MRNGWKEAETSTLPLFAEVGPGARRLRYSEAVGPFPMPVGAILQKPEVEKLPAPVLPGRVRDYPQFRFMGSKHRLLPWLHEILGQVEFDTVRIV